MLFQCSISSVQSLSHVQLFATPWTAAYQASLSITNSQSLLKLMSIESVMSSNHLILCGPLLLLPSTFPSIRVFSNESALHIRWPKYWSFSFSISPSNEYSGLIPTISLLGIYPEKMKTLIKKIGKIHAPQCSQKQFTIDNTWKQPKYPADRWMDKEDVRFYIYMMDLY